MKSTELLVAAAAVTALAAGAWMIGCGEKPPVAMVPARDDRPLHALEQRLRALESRREPAAPQRTTIDAPDADLARLTARVAALEAEVARLRSARTGDTPTDALPDTIEGIAAALGDKNLHGPDVPRELVQRRIALRRRWLELAPDREPAQTTLHQLQSDCLQGGDPDGARQLLDRFGVRVGMRRWQMDRAYAGVDSYQQRFDDARARYGSVAADLAAPEHARVDARFWQAYTFVQEGRDQDARPLFAQLLAEYGDDPPPEFRNTIGGARHQLEEIDARARRR